jgi:hypothetical protein
MAFYQNFSTDGGASWIGWNRIPANATSGPSVVSRGTGRLDLVARGTDDAIYLNQSFDAGGTWGGWTRIPAMAASGPGISSFSSGELDLWAMGQDSVLYGNESLNGGTSWSGWTRFAGMTMSSAPSGAVSLASGGTTDILVRGTDLNLYHQTISCTALGC